MWLKGGLAEQLPEIHMGCLILDNAAFNCLGSWLIIFHGWKHNRKGKYYFSSNFLSFSFPVALTVILSYSIYWKTIMNTLLNISVLKVFFKINLYVFSHVQLKLTLICSLGLTEPIFNKFPYHLLSKEKYTSERALKLAEGILKSTNLEKWRERELKDRDMGNFLTQGSRSRCTTDTLALHKIPQAKVPHPDLEVQPVTNICGFLKGQRFFQRKQLAQFKFSFVCCSFKYKFRYLKGEWNAWCFFCFDVKCF